ncbi:maltoporin [Planctomycetota bacterium]
MQRPLWLLIIITQLSLCGSTHAENSDTGLQTYEERIQALESRVRELEQGSAPVGDSNTVQVQKNSEAIEDLQKDMKRTTKDFDFQGYLRSGFGVNTYGDSMTPFQAPSSQAKYRLGNEAETYLEALFLTETPPEITQEKATFDTFIRLALSVPNTKTNTSSTQTSLRETYGIARGVLESMREATFWAGQRFYSRYDIHMNDFWFRDMSGFGGGIEKVPVAGDWANFSFAYLGGSIDELTSSGSQYQPDDFLMNMNSFDFGLSDIEVLGGALDSFFTVSHFSGDSFTDPLTSVTYRLEDSTGVGVNLIHRKALTYKLDNTFAAQYGDGAASNFRAVMVAPVGLITNNQTTFYTDSTQRWRVLDSLLWDTGTPWSFMSLFVYEEGDYGLAGPSRTKWASGGFRPVYHIDRFFSVAIEAGIDYTENNRSTAGTLYKLTVAPQITPEAKHLSRPALRAFVTYGYWTDGFVGHVGGSSYGDDNHGLNAGIQLETWW